MIAAGLGRERIARLLLRHGADVHILDDTMGASALHFAAQGGDVGMAKLLLDHGAHLNLQSPTHGITPLMNAVWYRNPDMTAFLLEQERINTRIRSHFGATARDLISSASATGSVPSAEAGNTDMSNPDSLSDSRKSGQTKEADEAERFHQLFEQYEKRLRETENRQTLFRMIVNPDQADAPEKQLECIRLISRDPAQVNAISPVTCSGSDGHTPLLAAARDGKTEVVKILLASGADPKMEDEYMRATPVHKAAYMGYTDVLRVLTEHPDFAKIVDRQGPFNGYTALHDAVWHGHLDAVKVLLDANANPGLRGHDGLTPYDLAVKCGYDEIADLLRPHSGLSP